MISGRFLVHDREDEKMELFVTKNFGETFSHAGDYIKSFYFDHREVICSIVLLDHVSKRTLQ